MEVDDGVRGSLGFSEVVKGCASKWKGRCNLRGACEVEFR